MVRLATLASFLFLFYYFSKVTIWADSTPPKFAWPIRELELAGLITSTFGESRKDHYHNGIDISSVDQPVHTLASGNVIYSRYLEDDPFEEERGSGNIVWIAHEKGFLSGYYHLGGKRHKNLKDSTILEENEVLGVSGNTGHSSGGHLHFVLGKEFGKVLVDPFSYLPKLEDKISPQIANLFIHVGDTFTNINPGDAIQISQNFPLTVAILDSGIKKSQRRGIESVKYYVNGTLFKEASFSILIYQKGEWLTTNGLRFDDLFFKDRYLVGSPNLKTGENTIRVIASDFTGLSSERTFSFTVSKLAVR